MIKKLLVEFWREKKYNMEKRERKYYQRNGYATEEVERWRAKGRWKENDDVREHDGEHIDVRGRDLGMEGTEKGRESARKIFERSAGSRLRNARFMVREE
jgi:hypothetical protein